jgi:hypothetical protein
LTAPTVRLTGAELTARGGLIAIGYGLLADRGPDGALKIAGGANSVEIDGASNVRFLHSFDIYDTAQGLAVWGRNLVIFDGAVDATDTEGGRVSLETAGRLRHSDPALPFSLDRIKFNGHRREFWFPGERGPRRRRHSRCCPRPHFLAWRFSADGAVEAEHRDQVVD